MIIMNNRLLDLPLCALLIYLITIVPDKDRILEGHLQMDKCNRILLSSDELTANNMAMNQSVLFKFGKCSTDLFNTEASTKLHLLMRHYSDHMHQFGCLFRCWSEENEQ